MSRQQLTPKELAEWLNKLPNTATILVIDASGKENKPVEGLLVAVSEVEDTYYVPGEGRSTRGKKLRGTLEIAGGEVCE